MEEETTTVTCAVCAGAKNWIKNVPRHRIGTRCQGCGRVLTIIFVTIEDENTCGWIRGQVSNITDMRLAQEEQDHER